MKTFLSVIFLIIGGQIACAGPSVSGGMPRAPMAVVIQGHTGSISFDQFARKKYLKLIGVHMMQERIVAVIQRPEFQDKNRTYICIEYKSNDDYSAAKEEFERILSSHPSVEVVSNTYCR